MKNRHKLVIGLFLFSLIVLLPAKVCMAAGVSVNIKADNNYVKKGDSVIVSIYLSSDELIGDFEGYLSYNADILEYQSDGGVAAGGEGLVKITDMGVQEGESSRKYALKFKAVGLGKSTFALNEETGIYTFESADKMSASSNQLVVEVAAEDKASDNANLKELKVNPGTLSGDFDPKENNYSITIDQDTNQLVISALPEDSKATVTISGNKDFKPGHNAVEVNVKAESGKANIYKLDVIKEETAVTEEEQNNEPEDGNEAEAGKIKLEKTGEETYLTGGFYLHLLIPEEDAAIPTGYSKTSLMINGVSVSVYTNTEDMDGDFLLLYGENKHGLKGFYQYDRRENTIQRFNPVSIKEGEKLVINKETRDTQHYQNQIMILGIVAAVLAGICSALAIGIIKLMLKNKGSED
ncbi:MAG: hypothetical protein K0R05_1952 [Anaerocolumna sp.]|jgi:hypothetical protein|nr:hypothetical protein [Anaerocolumna sp.]